MLLPNNTNELFLKPTILFSSKLTNSIFLKPCRRTHIEDRDHEREIKSTEFIIERKS